MAMSHRDRFKLKSQLLDQLAGQEWSWQRIGLLFGELGIERPSGDSFGPDLTDIVGGLGDVHLVELYALVFDVREAEVTAVVESVENAGQWKSGYGRVFLSHSAKHKVFVGEVATELAVMGIHGFVAHDTIEYSKPWQDQIEQALRSTQAFVALLHPEFDGSAWCHQEVGWALGRRVPIYAVRLGADQFGFLGSTQWPSGEGRTAKQVAGIIYQWVAGQTDLGPPILDGLFAALSEAGNYYDAEASAQRIVALGDLDDMDWVRLGQAFWSNDQAHGSVLVSKQFKPFYQQHRRDWPPPRPTPAPVVTDHWATATAPDEPPF